MEKIFPIMIRWSREFENPYDALCRNNDCVYMILKKRRNGGKTQYDILYIGMAYSQSCAERLKNEKHKLWKIMHEYYIRKPNFRGYIVAKFGEIMLPECSRLSERLVRDVEALLICINPTEYNENKPNCNRMLKITNMGMYSPLERIIDMSKLL